MKLRLDALRDLPQRTMLGALEAAVLAALAVQAARLTWALVTPLGGIGLPAPSATPPARMADLSILGQFDPFFRVADSGAQSAEPPSGGGFVLYGVRVAAGGRGSAILASAGGPQRSYLVGEEVEPGLLLRAVAPDHVILARGPGRQRVGFPRPQPGMAVLPPIGPAQPLASSSGPVIDLPRMLDQTTLLPRMKDGQPAGYQVIPRGGADALASAGLQRGDVLLAIDGVTLNAERAAQLREDLKDSTGAEIRFERGGQIMTTRIRMQPK